MAVPDTNTFNLREVAEDEFGIGDGDGLQDCFNDSSSGDFDPNHNPNSDGSSNNLLNFRNYGGVFAGQFINIYNATPGNLNLWSLQTFTLPSQYYGHDVRVVWKYTSGSSYTGDFQIGGNVFLGGTTFDLDTYSGTPWQTTRVDTANYSGATFYNIATGTVAMRWNSRSSSTTPSGGTGLAPSPSLGMDSTYYYAETSSGGNPYKRFWIRSPQVSISSGNDEIKWWRGSYGSTMGSYSIYLEIIT